MKLLPTPPVVDRPGYPMSAVATAPISDVTDDAIALLVERFYTAIRRHDALAPVFEAAIAPDEWPTHLATMRRFWSAVMLTSGAYSGNPVAVHRAVAGLERPMFAQWLAVFEATATALFTPELAAEFISKSHRIASSLERAVFHRLDAPPDGLALPARPASRSHQAMPPGVTSPRAALPCD